MSSANPTIHYAAGSPGGGIMTQTAALFVDAYRELNARKLFWITLILSLLVVGIFSLIGLTDNGFKLAVWEIRNPFWNKTAIAPETFYTYLFTAWAIPYWLGVGANILALMSVGSVFPDLLTSGAIDLYLSKPIGRIRLFLTKYLTGLLFVALQVFVFSFASFLVIGFRGGGWQWGIFLSVPLVTLLFSYLFCVCVLLGLLTRSTLASLLLTLLFWFVLYILNAGDGVLLALRSIADVRVEKQQEMVEFNQKFIDRNESLPPERRGNVSDFVFQRDAQAGHLAEFQKDADNLKWWHQLVIAIKAPLPKTGETVRLLDTWLVDHAAITEASEKSNEAERKRRAQRRGATSGPIAPPEGSRQAEFNGEDPEVDRRFADALRARGIAWSIGTSLGFELAVLGLCAWIFSRRDF